MSSLKDAAKAFIPKKTKNIADLDVVDLSLNIHYDGKGVDENGEEFTYSYVIKDEQEYRIPNSVISQIKSLLEVNPNISKIKVHRAGEGLKTRYTVIPIL